MGGILSFGSFENVGKPINGLQNYNNMNLGTITPPNPPPDPNPQPPSTQPPSTQPPSTQPPSTQPPSTQPPSTQPPSTQPPSTRPPPTRPTPIQPPQQSGSDSGIEKIQQPSKPIGKRY